MIIFTFGLGFPWTMIRMLRFIVSHIELAGDISFEELEQLQEDYHDATGSDLAGLLDIGFTI